MSGVWAFAGAFVTALFAVGGTFWAKRRNGPEMTEVVLSSVSDHVKRLDEQISVLSRELDSVRLRHAEIEAQLVAERIYTSLLVAAMESAGIEVPERKEVR